MKYDTSKFIHDFFNDAKTKTLLHVEAFEGEWVLSNENMNENWKY